MPIPDRARCLELGAAHIEHELNRMRDLAIGSDLPQTTSHEADLMKAVEWATAAATLRCLALQAKGQL